MTDQPGRFPITAGALLPDDYRQLFYAFDQGFCVFEVLLDDDGAASDYRFLEINHLFEQFTGLIDPVGRTALEMVPDLERSAHHVEQGNRRRAEAALRETDQRRARAGFAAHLVKPVDIEQLREIVARLRRGGWEVRGERSS